MHPTLPFSHCPFFGSTCAPLYLSPHLCSPMLCPRLTSPCLTQQLSPLPSPPHPCTLLSLPFYSCPQRPLPSPQTKTPVRIAAQGYARSCSWQYFPRKPEVLHWRVEAVVVWRGYVTLCLAEFCYPLHPRAKSPPILLEDRRTTGASPLVTPPLPHHVHALGQWY